MTKKSLIALILGFGILVTGVVLFVSDIREHAVTIVSTPPASAVPHSVPVSHVATTSTGASYVTGNPDRLIIPSLNMNLPVIPGYYDAATGAWTLTRTNVQFAEPTVQPNNQAGNTFIYGHALTNLFGSLPKIQSGAVAIVETDNGHTFFYTLSSTKVVSPADSSAVLNYSGKPILTLQTCVGLLYQSRELLTFNFQRVAQA